MFYRSGWLRCVVSMLGLCLSSWMVIVFRAMLTCGVISYTIIISYTYTILLYLILYYTLLSSSSHPHSPLILPILSSPLQSFFSLPSYPSLPLIHSILVGSYIRLFMFSSSVLLLPNNLTPHVLSEWMVEVCGKYLCSGLGFWKVIDIVCVLSWC